MSEESWIKELLLGIFGGLAALSSLLAGRLWVVQDARISAVEEQQKADRKNLAEEISRLHGKIDDTRREIMSDLATIVTLIQRDR